MKPAIIRALLISVASIIGVAGALALGASIASAGGPLMPIVTVPSGPVHAGQSIMVEASCPVFTTDPVTGAPVFDTIAQLRWGSHVIWRLPTKAPQAPQAPQACVATGNGGCSWPGTGICTGSLLNQNPAVFWIDVPSGASSGQIVGVDPYGSVIAEGKITVPGGKPQPTVPTGTTPTGTHTTPRTSTHGQTETSPTKPLTPHGESATHLPWWRAIWDRVLGWF